MTQSTIIDSYTRTYYIDVGHESEVGSFDINTSVIDDYNLITNRSDLSVGYGEDLYFDFFNCGQEICGNSDISFTVDTYFNTSQTKTSSGSMSFYLLNTTDDIIYTNLSNTIHADGNADAVFTPDLVDTNTTYHLNISGTTTRSLSTIDEYFNSSCAVLVISRPTSLSCAPNSSLIDTALQLNITCSYTETQCGSDILSNPSTRLINITGGGSCEGINQILTDNSDGTYTFECIPDSFENITFTAILDKSGYDSATDSGIVQVNEKPAIISPTDNPDPVMPGYTIRFSASISDSDTPEDADTYNFSSCKDATCIALWCSNNSQNAQSCTYTVQQSDLDGSGTTSYYIKSCDNLDYCNTSEEYTFDVDAFTSYDLTFTGNTTSIIPTFNLTLNSGNQANMTCALNCNPETESCTDYCSYEGSLNDEYRNCTINDPTLTMGSNNIYCYAYRTDAPAINTTGATIVSTFDLNFTQQQTFCKSSDYDHDENQTESSCSQQFYIDINDTLWINASFTNTGNISIATEDILTYTGVYMDNSYENELTFADTLWTLGENITTGYYSILMLEEYDSYNCQNDIHTTIKIDLDNDGSFADETRQNTRYYNDTMCYDNINLTVIAVGNTEFINATFNATNYMGVERDIIVECFFNNDPIDSENTGAASKDPSEYCNWTGYGDGTCSADIPNTCAAHYTVYCIANDDTYSNIDTDNITAQDEFPITSLEIASFDMPDWIDRSIDKGYGTTGYINISVVYPNGSSSSDAIVTLNGTCFNQTVCIYNPAIEKYVCTVNPLDNTIVGICTVNATAEKDGGFCDDKDGMPTDTTKIAGVIYTNLSSPNGTVYDPLDTTYITLFIDSDLSTENNLTGVNISANLTDPLGNDYTLNFTENQTDSGKYHANYTFSDSAERGYWNLTYHSTKLYYHTDTGIFENILYLNSYSDISILSVSPTQIDRDSGKYQVVNISLNASDEDSSTLSFDLNLTEISLITDQATTYELNLENCTQYDTISETYRGFCLWNPPDAMTDLELGMIDINITFSDSRVNSSELFTNQFEVNDIEIIYNSSVFDKVYYSYQNITPSAFVNYLSNSSPVPSGMGDIEIKNASDQIIMEHSASISDGFVEHTFNLSCIGAEEQWHFNASMNTSNLHEDNASIPDYRFNVSRLLTEVSCDASSNSSAFIFDCWYTDTINTVNLTDSETVLVANVTGSEPQCNGLQTLVWNSATETFRYHCEYSESFCVFVKLDVNASRSCYLNATTSTEYNSWINAGIDTTLTVSRPEVYSMAPTKLIFTLKPVSNITNPYLTFISTPTESTSVYAEWDDYNWTIIYSADTSYIESGTEDNLSMVIYSHRRTPPGIYTIPVNLTWTDPNCGLGSVTKYANITIKGDPYASISLDLNQSYYNRTDTVKATVNITNIGNCNITTDAGYIVTYIYDAFATSKIQEISCDSTPSVIPYLGYESISCQGQLNSGITAGNKSMVSIYRWNDTPAGKVSATETFVVVDSQFNVEPRITLKKDIVTIGEPVVVIDRFGKTTIQYIYVGSSK